MVSERKHVPRRHTRVTGGHLRATRCVLVAAIIALGCGSNEPNDHLDCPAGKTECDGRCVSLATHPAHCGACGHACADGVGCFAAACASPASAPRPRVSHAMVLGSDGLIYAFGGLRALHEQLSDDDRVWEVDAYDPSTNMWAANVDTLPKTRFLLEAVALDERIYLIGGADMEKPSLGEVMVYHVGSGWEDAPPLLTDRADAAAAASGGRIHVAWGIKDNYQTLLGDIEVFDGSKRSSMPTDPSVKPRWGARAVADSEGGIYFLGGAGPVGFPAPTGDLPGWDASTQVARLDATSSWRSLPPMLLPHVVGGTAAAPDGRIYYFGGADPEGKAVADVEVYDPVKDQWQLARPMPEPRFNARAVTAPDGRIYVIGGMTQYVLDFHALETMLVYDPELDQWYW